MMLHSKDMETTGKCKTFLVFALMFHFWISWFITEPSYLGYLFKTSSNRNKVTLKFENNVLPYTKQYEESRRETQR